MASHSECRSVPFGRFWILYLWMVWLKMDPIHGIVINDITWSRSSYIPPASAIFRRVLHWKLLIGLPSVKVKYCGHAEGVWIPLQASKLSTGKDSCVYTSLFHPPSVWDQHIPSYPLRNSTMSPLELQKFLREVG